MLLLIFKTTVYSKLDISNTAPPVGVIPQRGEVVCSILLAFTGILFTAGTRLCLVNTALLSASDTLTALTCISALLSYCDQPGDYIQTKVCLYTVCQLPKMCENTSVRYAVVPSKKGGGCRCWICKCYQNSLYVTCYCMHKVCCMVNISQCQVHLLLTVWIWNVSMYITDPRFQPKFLTEAPLVVSYLSVFCFLTQNC
jgi:hypothetical protein